MKEVAAQHSDIKVNGEKIGYADCYTSNQVAPMKLRLFQYQHGEYASHAYNTCDGKTKYSILCLYRCRAEMISLHILHQGIEQAAAKITVQGARYPERLEKMTGL